MGGDPRAEPAEAPTPSETPLARRGRRPAHALVWLLVVLVVLGAAVVIVDRVGHARAQRAVADRIAAELAANGVHAPPPDVVIDGTPFLDQVVSGWYERVTVRLREATTAGVALTKIQLTATGVEAELGTLLSGEGTVVADRVAGSARMGYAAASGLATLEGLEVFDGGDGLLGIRLRREVLGEPVFFVGTAELAVRSGVVRLHIQEMEVEEDALLPFAGQVADQYAQQYAQELSLRLRLPPLPFGLAIDTVTVQPYGLAITVSATDVTLAT